VQLQETLTATEWAVPRRGRLRRVRSALAPLPWLAPALVLILGVVVYPVVEMVITALSKIDVTGLNLGWTGMSNFHFLFAEPDLVHVFVNTAIWVVGVVGFTVVISLGLAQFLNKPFAGRRYVRWALIVPWAASLVMTGIVWRWMLNYYYGILNKLLVWLHVISSPIDWLSTSSTALPSLIVVGIIVSLPFTTYVFLAGLQTIPDEVYEAAKLDGSGSWQTYREIVLPLLRPALLVATVLNMIYVFNSFPIIWVMTQGGPGHQTDTSITFMYKLAFKEQEVGPSAALALINVAVILVAVMLYMRTVRWQDTEVS
jgi:multiple sugar transport system permease protein